MKYLHLIWAALFRSKTRTFLTLLSVITAFLLLAGLVMTFSASFVQSTVQTGNAFDILDSTWMTGIGVLGANAILDDLETRFGS